MYKLTFTYTVHLTLEAPITTAAVFFHRFSEKIRLDVSSESSARQRIHMKIKSYFLDVSSESSARQRIHMKNQVLFSLKDKSKQEGQEALNCSLEYTGQKSNI